MGVHGYGQTQRETSAHAAAAHNHRRLTWFSGAFSFRVGVANRFLLMGSAEAASVESRFRDFTPVAKRNLAKPPAGVEAR